MHCSVYSSIQLNQWRSYTRNSVHLAILSPPPPPPPPPPSMPSLFLSSSPNPLPESSSDPSWIDDFFNFSSAKCGAHRRTMSDSITFYKSVVVASSDESDATHARTTSVPGGPPASSSTDFDGLDDEQLMSMFSDDVMPPVEVFGRTGDQ